MKKILSFPAVTLIFFALAGSSFAFTKKELKSMGGFLTPFVRFSLENFDVKADGGDDIELIYDGKVYHFDGDVEGEDFSTVVEEAVQDGKIITMLGTFYSYGKPFRKFEAAAKTRKYNGKNTLAILSLKTGEIIQ